MQENHGSLKNGENCDRHENFAADTPLISVIIPFYNTEKYVKRCLDEVLQNSYSHLEVICVNDGSPAGDIELLRHYEAADPRVKLIDQKNAGVAAARNAGLKIAGGGYICFIDADDYVCPTFFETLLQAAEKENADMAICKIRRVKDSTEAEYFPCPEEKIEIFNTDTDGSREAFADGLLFGRLYKRSILRGITFGEEIRWGEDSAFNVCIFARHPALRIAVSNLPLYCYSVREQSFTHTRPSSVVVHTAEYYLKVMDSAPDDRGKWLYLREAMKAILHYRYTLSFDPMRKKEARRCSKALFRRCRAVFRELRTRPGWYGVYRLFAKFPSLYRLYRIVSDPTMLRWEKNQKKAARENKALSL